MDGGTTGDVGVVVGLSFRGVAAAEGGEVVESAVVGAVDALPGTTTVAPQRGH